MDSMTGTFRIGLVTLLMLLIVVSGSLGEPGQFRCGDINDDGFSGDLADIIYLANYLFLSGPSPNCPYACDCNRDLVIDLADVMTMINSTFLGGGPIDCPVPAWASLDGGCMDLDKAPAPGAATVSQSECIAYPNQPDDSTEYMFAEIVGDDLIVHHMNAYYNCCMMYAVTFDVVPIPGGYHVTVTEADTTNAPCYCMCYVNLEAVLPNLEVMTQTTYVVTLIHGEGHTVGTDTVTLGGDEQYIAAEAVGNDLYVYHMNAYMNCCPDFYTEFDFLGNVIRLYEFDRFNGCDCYCYYNLRTVLYDLYPGEYVVEVYGIWPQEMVCIGEDTVTISAEP